MSTLAVVVTHNRCELLSRCLKFIRDQSCPPDEILVINNGSTDGTETMLNQQGVSFITQENLGSAGGWHRGIRAAIEGGYDTVWLMDDDGFPDVNALATLKAAMKPGIACVSSIVVRADMPNHFVFPFPVLNEALIPVIFGSPRKIKTVEDLRAISPDLIYPFVHLFNGALLSVPVARLVGNVDKDFFIFGEEVDYFFRLRKAGRVISVLNAVHYHPDVSQRPYTRAKVYYYVKNTLILNSRYFNLPLLRHLFTIAAVLVRTARRNGLLAALSFVLLPRSAILHSAIMRGLLGKVGKDFNG